MRITYITLLLLISCAVPQRDVASTMQTGSGKYCHTNENGFSQCHYESLKKCHAAIEFLKGTCSTR
ncbi:MAG: hypothetical protein OEY33_01580 [Bdellovibrionales bacterium]|nr:hypothetical protein [Bdellovibrionales bacterium]